MKVCPDGTSQTHQFSFRIRLGEDHEFDRLHSLSDASESQVIKFEAAVGRVLHKPSVREQTACYGAVAFSAATALTASDAPIQSG
jgi:hypothetical protein